MTSLEEKMYKNIEEWRKLPEEKKQEIRRSTIISRVISSMDMEDEPVSKRWIKENKNAGFRGRSKP